MYKGFLSVLGRLFPSWEGYSRLKGGPPWGYTRGFDQFLPKVYKTVDLQFCSIKETSSLSDIPCAKVLSVAGFCASLGVLPVPKVVYFLSERWRKTRRNTGVGRVIPVPGINLPSSFIRPGNPGMSE